MSMLLIFFIILTVHSRNFVTTSGTTKEFVITRKFVENVKEYVNLHLLQELQIAGELSKTPDGRKWLRKWEIARNSILEKIFLARDTVTGKYFWSSDWRSRLQYFQSVENEYLKDFVFKNYDVRDKLSSLPKITFDESKLRTIVHPIDVSSQEKSKDVNIADPFATDDDLDHVLRFHSPYSDKEKTELKIKKLQKLVTVLQRNITS